MHRGLVLAFTAALGAATAFACTTTSTVGRNPSGLGAADAAREATVLVPTDAGELKSDSASPAPSCELTNGSGSSGSDGSCLYGEEWSCPEGKRTIDCSCPAATCTCGTETFAHDCTQGCTPTAEEREHCKIPAPPTDDGGGSSTSSSGG